MLLLTSAIVCFIGAVGFRANALPSEADLQAAFAAYDEVDKYLTYGSRYSRDFAEDMEDIGKVVSEASLDLDGMDYGLKALINMVQVKKVLDNPEIADSLKRLNDLIKILDRDPSVVCSDSVTESIKIVNHYAKDPIHRLLKFRKKLEGGHVKMGRLDYLIVEAARRQAQTCDPDFQQRESRGVPELDMVVSYFERAVADLDQRKNQVAIMIE